MLMENKVEILELNKKNKIFEESHSLNIIISEIFRKLLVNADKILKITEYNKPKYTTNVEEFIQSISKSKSLDLKRKPRLYLSELHYYSMIILSTKIKEIKKINIMDINTESFFIVFSELIKEFNLLENLKISIQKKDKYNCIYSSIIKVLEKSLKKITHICLYFRHKCYSNLYKKYYKKYFKLFSYFMTFEPLIKFKLINFNIAHQEFLSHRELQNVVSRSRLVILNLREMSLSYEQLLVLAIGLNENQTITHLKLEKFRLVDIKSGNQAGYNIEIKGLVMILSTLRLKNCYKSISLFYSDWDIEERSVKDKYSELYLSSIKDLLVNNSSLIEFNVCMVLPKKFLFIYSEIILEAVRKNKGLKIINFFDIKEILSDDDKTTALGYKYYQNGTILKVNDVGMQIRNFNSKIHRLIPIIFSELIKNVKPFSLDVFFYNIFLKNGNCQRLSLKNDICRQSEKRGTFFYNFLDTFLFLKDLTISDEKITFNEIKLIEKHLEKLECLETIKLFICKFCINDLYAFLSPRNITLLESSPNKLISDDFSKLSEKIKSSKLEKLILSNLCYIESPQTSMNFHLLIEAFICNSLKSLELYIKFTQDLLDILISKLRAFKSLEYLGVSITNDFSSFQSPLKNLVSLFKSQNTLICTVKIYKYEWDIKSFHRTNDFNLTRNQLNPADLMMFAEFCKQNIIKKICYINLSENKEIIDENFIESIVEIAKTLEGNEIIIKNSSCGQQLIAEIKSLLGSEKDSLVNFIID